MTTHYLDITILPDPEFSHAHLMGSLLSKLHRALVQHGKGDIGVSFPLHVDALATKRTLGSIVRLHGTPQALQALEALNWLKGMRDHIALGSVLAVPAGASHRQVLRRQFKTSVERLRRRRMQRKGETAEQAAQAIPMHVERKPNLPFANLRSLSTGQIFALFIEHGPLLPQPVDGSFNTYGLSQGASIPWF
ncbi:type I-F CRISPR-associated endoribonuclease Cas6/Csy4 [Comamonas kerstersii]|uniref:Type I-F CRISPR-associated endoribonuclease Cas6/Csy4 n=1 Tax=Comamonas kerstersii TaxID=225992 RepID=A0A6A1R6A0_9BURK|nr:type I-F CRISPR-associated endoribonuclease Cas6/Csy4 [Comamonas kerstersii]KAB0588568.1 type I-F CRISPR-associated endoribonuclease Cas6/Csy4 [Comamonas kerstersii]